mgnify:CR=1 FL=1
MRMKRRRRGRKKRKGKRKRRKCWVIGIEIWSEISIWIEVGFDIFLWSGTVTVPQI